MERNWFNENMYATEEEIDRLEGRVSVLEERAEKSEKQHDRNQESIEDFRREVAAWRAEAKARDDAQASAISGLSSDLRTMTVELAKNTGAQEAKARIDEQSIRNWKKAAVIFGIIFGFITMISGIFFSNTSITSTLTSTLKPSHSRYIQEDRAPIHAKPL